MHGCCGCCDNFGNRLISQNISAVTERGVCSGKGLKSRYGAIQNQGNSGGGIPYEQQLALGDAYCFDDSFGKYDKVACHIRSLDGKKILGMAWGNMNDGYNWEAWAAANRNIQYLRSSSPKQYCGGGGTGYSVTACLYDVDYAPNWTAAGAWWTGASKNWRIYRFTKDQVVRK